MSAENFMIALQAAGGDVELVKDVLQSWLDSALGSYRIGDGSLLIHGKGEFRYTNGLVVLLPFGTSGGPPEIALLCEEGLILGQTEDQKWSLAAFILSLSETDRFFAENIAQLEDADERKEFAGLINEAKAQVFKRVGL